MAKKKQNKKTSAVQQNQNVLPPNILPVGERVEENKNIYISQPVYKQIQSFTRNKTTNESGGMLVGSVIEAFGKTNVIISGFVEAKYSEGTPTTLKFTHETWEYVHREIEKKHKGQKIVGWIHTHPDFGIFLSEYDKFIHQNFFSEAYQVAYVVDPIQQIEGFYFWINGAIERCKGFYVYDKTGAKIKLDLGSEETRQTERSSGSRFGFKDLLLVTLTAAVIFLFFVNLSHGKRIKELERNQEYLNLNQYTLQQMLLEKDEQLRQLTQILIDADMIPQEEQQEFGETGSEDIPGAQEEEGTPDA